MHTDLLARIFGDADICGTEKPFHAILCHHLMNEEGLRSADFVREYRSPEVPRCSVDIAVFARHTRGHWSRPGQTLIEVKGSAYGDRNALRDRIDCYGQCDDIKKLARYPRDLERWLICFDLHELGIAVGPKKRILLAENCAREGINVAFFAQGESEFLVGCAGRIDRHPIARSPLMQEQALIVVLGATDSTALQLPIINWPTRTRSPSCSITACEVTATRRGNSHSRPTSDALNARRGCTTVPTSAFSTQRSRADLTCTVREMFFVRTMR